MRSSCALMGIKVRDKAPVSVNGTNVPRMQLILKGFGFTEDQWITMRRWPGISK